MYTWTCLNLRWISLTIPDNCAAPLGKIIAVLFDQRNWASKRMQIGTNTFPYLMKPESSDKKNPSKGGNLIPHLGEFRGIGRRNFTQPMKNRGGKEIQPVRPHEWLS